MSTTTGGSILLIGGSGYLGSLVTAGLLAHTNECVVVPLRDTTSREAVIDKIKAELPVENEVNFERLITAELPPVHELQGLYPLLHRHNVSQIIHCAGSVDYFDSARLTEVNIDLTGELLSLGKKQNIQRFVYLSTAFSSGYQLELIPETIHNEPESDPTEYTKSKREAERMVSNSLLPYLIIRPSVVIGDSHTGQYLGKAYGLYQLWSAFEKFLSDRYREQLHFIAPQMKLQVVHQDAFQAGFLAAMENLPNNSIIHLTSKQESLPTVKDVTELWCRLCTKTTNIRYYDRYSEVPIDQLDRRMKMWLEFTEVNNDIAAYPWQFENTALDKLRANGLKFPDATINTIRICQDRFVAQSDRIKTFLINSEQELFSNEQAREPETVSNYA